MTRSHTIVVAFALALACAAARAAEPVGPIKPIKKAEHTFTTSKDTYVTNEKEGKPGDRSHRNYGAAPALHLDTQYNGEKSHVLIEFDLAALPKNATILTATLAMGARIKPAVGTAVAVEVRRLLRDDWIEGEQGGKTHKEKSGASWIARRYTEDGPVKWQTPGATGAEDSDAKTLIALKGTKQIDELDTGISVLPHVTAWHAERKTALGWVIRTVNTKINLYRWASSDAPNTQGPTLTIAYTLPDLKPKPAGED